MAKNVRNAIRDPRHNVSAERGTAVHTNGSRDRGYAGTEYAADTDAGHADYEHDYERIGTWHYRIGKRLMDIGLVVVASPLILLAFATVAAIIRLSSRGPIFYKQQRIGRYGITFTMFKFRTMKVDADQILLNHLLTNPAAHHEWMQKHKLSEDPRLTPCGRFLRTTSLDELPQIWNVLLGNMSLVGPRPIIWAEKERYSSRFRFYTAVLPGLTGLWQTSGRCNLPYAVRVRLDEQYVRQWSLPQDLRILLKTPLAVCCREGAY